MNEISQLVERDIAITAKVLQLTNSAFFNLPRTITRIAEAIIFLGLETLKVDRAVRRGAHRLPAGPADRALLDRAARAPRHARGERRPGADAARQDPWRGDGGRDAARHRLARARCPGARARRRRAGVRATATASRPTRSSASAAGRPTPTSAPICSRCGGCRTRSSRRSRAITRRRSSNGGLGPAGAVYLADALLAEQETPRGAGVDEDYVAALGLSDRLADWRLLAEQMI